MTMLRPDDNWRIEVEMKYALCIIITALLSYLWGSLNSAIIAVRLIKGEDIREKGSGNAGLTNVIRVYGKGLGVVTLLGDLFKGVIAVLLARYIVTNVVGVTFFGGDKIFIGYIAGLFTIIGHMFPRGQGRSACGDNAHCHGSADVCGIACGFFRAYRDNQVCFGRFDMCGDNISCVHAHLSEYKG